MMPSLDALFLLSPKPCQHQIARLSLRAMLLFVPWRMTLPAVT